MSQPALLLPSDDSDGGEVDVVTRRTKRKRRCEQPWFLNIYLVFVLATFVSYLTYNQYVLKKKFHELNETLSSLMLLPSRLQVVEKDIHRLQMEFDLGREQDPSNGTKSAITYVYDVLDRLENELSSVRSSVHKANNAMEDAIQRISMVEGRCLAVCQMDDFRDKQRRRQAEKKATYEIIFKRGGGGGQ